MNAATGRGRSLPFPFAAFFWWLVVTGCQPDVAGEHGSPASHDPSTRETPVSSAGEAGEGTPPGTDPDTLRLVLEIPSAVDSGVPVPITLRIENVTDRRLDLYLTGRTIAFDVIVRDEAGDVVWNRLHDQAVQQILRHEPLAPRASLTLDATWDQRRNDAGAARRGAYTVSAEVPTESDPLVASPVTLRIE